MDKLNVLGAGVMGRQITALFCLAGYEVFVWNRHIDEEIKGLQAKELKIAERVLKKHGQMGNVQYVENIDALEPLLTYEILIEDINVKREVISHLPYKIEKNQLITNTSSYSPIEVHDNAMGLHFFNPVYYLRFAELAYSSEELGPSIKALIDRLKNTFGFEFIATSMNRGYIGNYLLFHEIANALKLIDEYGYKTDKIDRILFHMGRTESLFNLIDLVGVDVCRKIILNLREKDPSLYISPLLDVAIRKNILGKKNNTTIRCIIDNRAVEC